MTASETSRIVESVVLASLERKKEQDTKGKQGRDGADTGNPVSNRAQPEGPPPEAPRKMLCRPEERASTCRVGQTIPAREEVFGIIRFNIIFCINTYYTIVFRTWKSL